MTELWRVADDCLIAPAHLVARSVDINGQTVARVTACGWQPAKRGLVISRAEMLRGHRFVCCCCAEHAVRRDQITAEVMG